MGKITNIGDYAALSKSERDLIMALMVKWCNNYAIVSDEFQYVTKKTLSKKTIDDVIRVFSTDYQNYQREIIKSLKHVPCANPRNRIIYMQNIVDDAMKYKARSSYRTEDGWAVYVGPDYKMAKEAIQAIEAFQMREAELILKVKAANARLCENEIDDEDNVEDFKSGVDFAAEA